MNDMTISDFIIHVDKGRCPHCGGIVRVIESEMSEILLNSDGSPRSSCPLSYNCVGFCGNCQRPLYIDPTGNGYKVLPATHSAVYLHNTIKNILGDHQRNFKK